MYSHLDISVEVVNKSYCNLRTRLWLHELPAMTTMCISFDYHVMLRFSF